MIRSELKRTMPTKEPKVRVKKCCVAGCRKEFTPTKPLQRACSTPCAIDFAMSERARKERKERQEGLVKLKRRADWLKEAQASLNAFIRERDAALPCISCGRHHQGQYHAGHYLARGSHPHLALTEANLAKQCMPCNVHLSGNQLNFRRGLIARIGIAAVEALESDCSVRKWSVEELIEIKQHYRAKLKALKQV